MRFDHLYREFQEAGALLQKHVGAGLKSFRLAKACAFRMAKVVIRMQEEDHNLLLAQVKAEKLSVDEWLDKWFLPMEAMNLGEDYRALMRAVKEGMTLRQYQNTTPVIFLAEKSRRSSFPVRSGYQELAVPSAPTDTATIEEADMDWQSRCIAMEAQNKQLKSMLGERDRRIATLERTVKRLHRILNQVSS